MNTNSKQPTPTSLVSGTIINARPGPRYLVELDTGEQIEAILNRSRKFGCLFGNLAGHKVAVKLAEAPKMHRIVELHASPTR